jgi:hypothetical protein
MEVEVQDQSFLRVYFFQGLSPWLVDHHLLTVSSRGLSSVHTQPWCLCVTPGLLLLIRTFVRLDEGSS